MERLNQNIDKGQDKAKKLFESTEDKRDDALGRSVFVHKVDAFQGLVATAKIGPEAKRELYSDLDQFFQDQIGPMIPVENRNLLELASGKLGDMLAGNPTGSEESKKLLKTAQSLNEHVDELTEKLSKKEEAERQRIEDLILATEEAQSQFELATEMKVDAMKKFKKAEKEDNWLLKIEADADLKEAGNLYETAVDTLEGEVKSHENVDFSSEFGVKLDSVRTILAQIYVMHPDYQIQIKGAENYDEKTATIDKKRYKLLMEVKQNEAYRSILDGIEKVSAVNPKGFEDFAGGELWVEAVGGDITFTKKFFKAKVDVRSGVMLRLQAKTMLEQNKIDLAKEKGYKKDFYAGKILFANAKIPEANIKFKKFRKALTKDPKMDPKSKEKLTREVNYLLKQIAIRKLTTLEDDLATLLSQRKERLLVADWHPGVEAARKILKPVMEDLQSGKAFTLEEALGRRGEEAQTYRLLFQLATTDDPARRAATVAAVAAEMDKYSGATKVARRVIDEHFQDKLDKIKLDPRTIKQLRAKVEKDAVKYGWKIEDKMKAELVSMKDQIDQIDRDLRREPNFTVNYRQMKQQKKALLKSITGMADVHWTIRGGVRKAGFDAEASEIRREHGSPLVQRTQAAMDKVYQKMLRKAKYKVLQEQLSHTDATTRKILDAAVKMDDLNDEWDTISSDNWNEAVDTTAQTAFDVSTMVVGMGSGAMAKYAAAKLMAKYLGKKVVQTRAASVLLSIVQHTGEGFGATAGTSTLQAISLMTKGQSGAAAFKDFDKAWANSALMFMSVHSGTKLIGGSVLGRKAMTLKSGKEIAMGQMKFAQTSGNRAARAAWLGYQGAALSVEVATLANVDEMAQFAGLTPKTKQEKLKSISHHLATVLKFRMAAKAWKATKPGKELYKWEERTLQKADQIVQQPRIETEADRDLTHQVKEVAKPRRPMRSITDEGPMHMGDAALKPNEDYVVRDEAPDYSDKHTFRARVAELKTDLKSGKLDKPAYSNLVLALRRQRYLDLMGNIMTNAEKLMKSTPDATADQLFDALINSKTNKLKASKWQRKIIREAIDKYVAQRKVVRERHESLKTDEGKRKFLDDVGLSEVKIKNVEFDLSNPISFGIGFKNPKDFAALYYEKPPSEITKADWDSISKTGGFACRNSNFKHASLNDSVVAWRIGTGMSKQKVMIHELQHRMFHEFYNHNLYKSDRERVATLNKMRGSSENQDDFVKRLRLSGLIEGHEKMRDGELMKAATDINDLDYITTYLRDEILAYTKDGRFQIKEAPLMELKIEDMSHVSAQVRIELRRSYIMVTSELRRLSNEGYDSKKVFEKIKTAENIYDVVERLRQIGSKENPEYTKTLELRIDGLNKTERGILKMYGDKMAGPRLSTRDKIEIADMLISDRMSMKPRFRKIAEQLGDSELVSSLESAIYDTETGRLMTWEKRFEKIVTLRNLKKALGSITRHNPELAKHIETVHFDGKTGELLTPEKKLIICNIHLAINAMRDDGKGKIVDEISEKIAKLPILKRKQAFDAHILANEAKVALGEYMDIDSKAAEEVAKYYGLRELIINPESNPKKLEEALIFLDEQLM